MGVPHNVLNARYHEQEAQIIAQAGVPGAVTIATNMAGRGTDIQLGGNADMRIATELADVADEGERAAPRRRHPAPKSQPPRQKVHRRPAACSSSAPSAMRAAASTTSCAAAPAARAIPGGPASICRSKTISCASSAPSAWTRCCRRSGLKEGEAIVHPWINKALEKAQQKVEARNFDIRKNLLKFDNVMNDQRKVIFEQRIEHHARRGRLGHHRRHAPPGDRRARRQATSRPNAYAEQWDAAGLREQLREAVGIDLPVEEWAKEEGIADEEIRERVRQGRRRALRRQAREICAATSWAQVEKAVLLQTLDHLWREHLVVLEHLRQVIGLRGYGQRDPLNEYKTEGFNLFEAMITRLREMTTAQLMRVEIADRPPEGLPVADQLPAMEAHHMNPLTGQDDMLEAALAFAGTGMAGAAHGALLQAGDGGGAAPWFGKVGRNEQCPCGSGKKFKHCHGAFA